MSPSTPEPEPSPARWDVAAESVAVKIRWFGLVVGYLYANVGASADPVPLNVLLGLWLAWHGYL